jgi:hypothetical protein
LLTADGTPKITDFGLARWLDADENRTQSGAILGTAPYMAPEQARGQSKEVRQAADVWALGAILYRALTGRPPFLGLNWEDTLLQVLSHDPVSPSLLNPEVNRDLEAICLKCLAKAPADRYASAAELADDLGRYLASEPPSARSPTLWEWILRAVSAQREVPAFTALGSLLLLLAALCFAGPLAAFFLLLQRGPEALVWLALFAPYLGLFGMLRFNGAAVALPTSPAQRQIWAIWIGHLLASATLFAASRIAQPDYVEAFLAAHPARAALYGLAFFVMGSRFWGRDYVFGLAWMLLALVMPLAPIWAPLETGILNGLCVLIIARDMRRQQRESARSDEAGSR